MAWIKAIFLWLAVVAITIPMFAVLSLVMLLCRLLRYRRSDLWTHYFAGIWSRSIFRMVPGWKISIQGLENLPPPQASVIYVANHQSLTDIWTIYFVPRQFKWLSKKEVFDIPLIGLGMRWAGYIPILRGDRASMQVAMTHSRSWLEQGTSMFFFPEGTRSVDGVLKDFKIGAFRLAEDSGVAICPITLCGTGNLIKKGSALPSSAHVKIKIDPPMRRRPDETIDEFAARVRLCILNNLDDYQP